MSDLYLVKKQFLLEKSDILGYRYVNEHFSLTYTKNYGIRIFGRSSSYFTYIDIKTDGEKQEVLNSVIPELLEIIQKESSYLDRNYMKNPLKEIFAKELLFI
jgi:hypothetical protein